MPSISIGAIIEGVVDAATAAAGTVGTAASAAADFVGGGLAADIGGAASALGIPGTATTGLAGALGSVGQGGLEGAALGAATDPSKPLVGAERGGITGAFIGGGPALGGITGLGSTIGDVAAGAAGGALGNAVTGANPGIGALTGGVSGGVASAFGPSSGGGSTAPSGAGSSAVAAAAPASVPSAAAPPTEALASPGTSVGSLSTTTPAPGISLTGDGTFSTPSITPNAPTTPQANLSALSTGTPNVAAAPAGSSGISGWLNNNRWAIPAAGLGLEALRGSQPLPGQKALEASAAQAQTQANQLESYVRSGTLPPGLQAGIDAASEAAKASIRSQYARMGGDSSAEAQDIAYVDQAAKTQGAQIALSLMQQGVSEQGMANQLYTQLMELALQRDNALGSAIGSFASALVPTRTA